MLETTHLIEQISTLLTQARHQMISTVNQTMVQTYRTIGKIIVEDEQWWKERAAYGHATLAFVSRKLVQKFWKWFSERNLRRMRELYMQYPIWTTVSSKFNTLSWSHHIFLLGIKEEDKRSFYAIESQTNNWSLRELRRQFDSSLYHRLALSKDKAWILALSKQGQIIEQPHDAIKEPYILEFLGLEEKASYSETELEQAIIDNLQQFLLELGKGYMFVARQQRITID